MRKFRKLIFNGLKLFILITFCNYILVLAATDQKILAENSPCPDELWKIMQNADSYIQKLCLPGSVVRKVISPTSSMGGHQNVGIAIIECGDGDRVLKFYSHDRNLTKMKYSILIQWYLGKFGICPKIDGILMQNEIAFLKKNNLIPSDMKASFGVIMEKISSPWNFNREKNIPLEANSWDHRANIDFMNSLVPLTERLRIMANDPQFLVSKEGRVYYFDLDMVWYVTPELELLGNVLPKHLRLVLKSYPNAIKKIKSRYMKTEIQIYKKLVKKFLKN